MLPKLVLVGGITGMATGFALQYWASVIAYPMNIGGRPLRRAGRPSSSRAYELTILFAALTAAIGMIVLNGLPQPYHPVFNVERFSMASSRQVLPRASNRRTRSSTQARRSEFLHEHRARRECTTLSE